VKFIKLSDLPSKLTNFMQLISSHQFKRLT
jgi:hypothetical protein